MAGGGKTVRVVEADGVVADKVDPLHEMRLTPDDLRVDVEEHRREVHRVRDAGLVALPHVLGHVGLLDDLEGR